MEKPRTSPALKINSLARHIFLRLALQIKYEVSNVCNSTPNRYIQRLYWVRSYFIPTHMNQVNEINFKRPIFSIDRRVNLRGSITYEGPKQV